MYAIVQVGGRQYRATPGDRLVVDRMAVAEGDTVQLEDVRMLVAEEGESGETRVGRPRLEDVSVAATAVAHFRGPKLIIFKYKPKKRYRRKRGFRAELTELHIDEVNLGGLAPKPRRAAAAKAAPATAAAKAAPATSAAPAPRAAKSDGAKAAAVAKAESTSIASTGPKAALATEASAPAKSGTTTKASAAAKSRTTTKGAAAGAAAKAATAKAAPAAPRGRTTTKSTATGGGAKPVARTTKAAPKGTADESKPSSRGKRGGA